MFRGGNQSMILAIAIMLSALTIFNADRRRSAGVELDYGHHDRLLVDEVNELHVKMMGVPRYGGGDDQRVRFQLRPMLPDSGARFGAAVDFSEFEPLARLHERRKQRLKARATANAAPAAAAADAKAWQFELFSGENPRPSVAGAVRNVLSSEELHSTAA